MRVWFRFAEDFHCVNGDFEFVSDLCSAIHEKLGKASPSAVCLQLMVSGKALSPSDECADVVPASVTFHPKKDVAATPLELSFKSSNVRVGSHRPTRRSNTPQSHSRPSSGGRSRPRHVNPVATSETDEFYNSTSCDEATIVAACKNANRNLRRFDRNPALRGKDYFDHHMERIAEQLHTVADRYADQRTGPATAGGSNEVAKPPTSPKIQEWVVMLCPPSNHELQTRCIPCPSSRPVKCLDVIRHIQRQVTDFLISEAFYYDEGFKDYVPLNDASTGAMTGLLFVLCKPHRTLSLQHHAIPEAPRPDNLRHTVMMSEYYNRLAALLRGMESDEVGYRATVQEEEQKTRVSMGMQEHQLHTSVAEFARVTNTSAAQRTTTPKSRRPWYERVSPAGTPNKEDPPRRASPRRPAAPTAAAAGKPSPKKEARLVLTPAAENPIRTPAVPASSTPTGPALASAIVAETVSTAVNQSESRRSPSKRLDGLPGSTEHKQSHDADHWGLPAAAGPPAVSASPVEAVTTTSGRKSPSRRLEGLPGSTEHRQSHDADHWGLPSNPNSTNASFTGPPKKTSRPSTPVVKAEDPQWGISEGQKVVDKPSDISNVRLSVEVQKHDNDHWGGPTPAVAEEGPQWGVNGASKPSPKTTTGAVPPAGEAPPVAPKPCAADGVIRAEHPQWGVSDDKKPVGVEEPSVIKSRLSVHTRQHENDHWGSPWSSVGNPVAPNAVDVPTPPAALSVGTPITANGGFTAGGQMINTGIRIESDKTLMKVRQFWYGPDLTADAKASLGLEFFKLALMQHPNLARGAMSGWDLVAASTEYNTIIDLMVRGALSVPLLKSKIATARSAGMLSDAHPISERHHHYFITTTISALLSLTPKEKHAQFNEEFAESWRRILTSVVADFTQCQGPLLGPQTGHTFQNETTLTAQVLALEAPAAAPVVTAPADPTAMKAQAKTTQPNVDAAYPIPPPATPPSLMLVPPGAPAAVGTPSEQTIAPIPDMVLASMEKPQLSAVGNTVPETTTSTNVGDLAAVHPSVRAGGATTPPQQKIAPISEMVLASMEKPKLTAAGEVPETSILTSVGEIADVERPAAQGPRATGYTAPSFMPVAGTTVGRSEYKLRLAAFFAQYCPEMTSVVDETLARVKGSEDALFARLTSKYGPEPVTVVDDAPRPSPAPAPVAPAATATAPVVSPEAREVVSQAINKVAPPAPVVAAPAAPTPAGVPVAPAPVVEEEPELGAVKKSFSNYEV